MKSANPETSLVRTVKESLDKDPTDEERIISCFTAEDQTLATIIVSAYVDQKRDLATMKEVMVRMQEKQDQTYNLLLSSNHNKKITSVSLSRFFDLHPEILEGFSYDGESILHNAEKLKPDSNALLALSIKLEDYFGTKEIHFKDLLVAMKRYFFKHQQQMEQYHDQIILLCEEYLSECKTKRRTRVPLKYLKTIIDLPNKDIKNLMTTIGYKEWKDKSGSLYYYP